MTGESNGGKWREAAAWLGALLATFLACEVALRVYQKVTRDVPMTTFLPHYRETQFPLSPFLVFGPRVDWQIPGKENPELAYFNEQGIRIQGRVGEKRPGEYRIFVLGGSTSESVWNEVGIHWPLVLECSLREAGYDGVRVYNTAMSAYTTAHSLIRLQYDVLDYEPDMVIVMHNVNDLLVNYDAALQGRRVDGHYLVRYGQDRYTNVVTDDDVVISRILWSLRTRLGELTAEPPEPVENYDIESGRRVFARNLRYLATTARDRGADVVFVTMPFTLAYTDQEVPDLEPGQVGLTGVEPEPGQHAANMEAYNSTIVEVAEREGAAVVDMAELFGKNPEFFVDIVHYSTAGIERFGEALAHELSPMLQDPLGRTTAMPGERCRS